MIPALLLAGLTVLLAIWTWRDRREYARFKALTRTEDRQRTYARWVAQAFALFTLGAVLCLALIGQLPAIFTPPAVFAPLMRQAQAAMGEVGGLFLLSMICAFIVAQLAATFVAARSSAKNVVVVGDIEALMPRNRAEYGWCALLSVNAGIGEELFFRLLYPLLLATVVGDALPAFILAAIVFGLVHFYQGWVGVLATAAVGGVMTVLYLATGSLLWPILLHAAIDLRGLVLHPMLTAWLQRAPRA